MHVPRIQKVLIEYFMCPGTNCLLLSFAHFKSLTGNLFYKSLFDTIRSGLTGAGTQKDCETHDLIQEVILGQRNMACLRIYSPQDFLFHQVCFLSLQVTLKGCKIC